MSRNQSPQEYRNELKKRILELSMGEFARNGIRTVKMDDIASMLGISKRTLYEVYANKEDLLFEGLMRHEEEIDAYLRQFANEHSNDVMDILVEVYDMQMKVLATMSYSFFDDLPKYPRVREFLEQRQAKRNEGVKKFIQRGVAEGYFRDDVDYNIVEQITSMTQQQMITTRFYSKYPMDHIFRNAIFLFIRGFCTMKGIEKIDQRMV